MNSSDWKDILAGMSIPAESDESSQIDIVTCKKSLPKSVTLFFERKGRAGKTATILADFIGIDEEEIKVLASDLKRSLGCGGSVSGGEILIQGDRRNDLRRILIAKGFKVKGA